MRRLNKNPEQLRPTGKQWSKTGDIKSTSRESHMPNKRKKAKVVVPHELL
jgi:hypothetical protein